MLSHAPIFGKFDQSTRPAYAGDKGVAGQSPSTLTRLLLEYQAILDDDAPAALKSYAATTADELRRTLDRAVAA